MRRTWRNLARVGDTESPTRTVADTPTGVSLIAVLPDGRKGIGLAANADAWTEADLEEMRGGVDDAPTGPVPVVDCEIPPFVVEAAVDAAHERGLSVLLGRGLLLAGWGGCVTGS